MHATPATPATPARDEEKSRAAPVRFIRAFRYHVSVTERVIRRPGASSTISRRNLSMDRSIEEAPRVSALSNERTSREIFARVSSPPRFELCIPQARGRIARGGGRERNSDNDEAAPECDRVSLFIIRERKLRAMRRGDSKCKLGGQVECYYFAFRVNLVHPRNLASRKVDFGVTAAGDREIDEVTRLTL